MSPTSRPEKKVKGRNAKRRTGTSVFLCKEKETLTTQDASTWNEKPRAISKKTTIKHLNHDEKVTEGKEREKKEHLRAKATGFAGS